MSISEKSIREFRFTGWHMLASMAVFFGVIIAVNLTMATLASRSWTGLVVKNSYIASQGFNDRLKEAKRQSAAGFRSQIFYQHSTLAFRITEYGKKNPIPHDAKVWIGRPAFEQQDKLVPAICGLDGNCNVNIDLQPGLWAIRIEANIDKTPYRRDARLWIAADGKLKVE